MTTKEAITILKHHQAWRKGSEIKQVDVKKLSEAIDLIIKIMNQISFSSMPSEILSEREDICRKQLKACSLWIEDSRVLDCPLVTDED